MEKKIQFHITRRKEHIENKISDSRGLNSRSNSRGKELDFSIKHVLYGDFFDVEAVFNKALALYNKVNKFTDEDLNAIKNKIKKLKNNYKDLQGKYLFNE